MSSTITRYRGDTYPAELTVLDSTGSVVNVVGWSFILSVTPRADPTWTEYVYQVVGVVTDAAAGRVDFPLTDAQARTPPGTYYYDIQATDGLGARATLVKGRLLILQDVTKEPTATTGTVTATATGTVV